MEFQGKMKFKELMQERGDSGIFSTTRSCQKPISWNKSIFSPFISETLRDFLRAKRCRFGRRKDKCSSPHWVEGRDTAYEFCI